MAKTVLLEKDGYIGRIIFNDPDRLNAMTLELAEEFPKVIEEVKNDPELRCVILTGAGRAFSAGGNLDMIFDKMKKTPEANEAEMQQFYNSFLCIRDLEIPTIAYINGHAIGAGFCVALACDLRITHEKAKMGVNFTRLGLSPGMGATWLLGRLSHYTVAANLLFTARTISAAEAQRLGLVNEVHSVDQAAAAVQQLAETIALNSPVAVRETKKALQANLTLPLPDALVNESKGQAVCFQTEDLGEGVNAIKEKREPQFKGK